LRNATEDASGAVLVAARSLMGLHSPEILDRVAKVHFKTTAKLRG